MDRFYTDLCFLGVPVGLFQLQFAEQLHQNDHSRNGQHQLGCELGIGQTIEREEVVEEEMVKWNDTLIQEVEAEIERMPEQTREIIRSVFFHEMKYQEVADALGISINSVKTLLKNGMRHLRERFAERMDLFLVMVLIN